MNKTMLLAALAAALIFAGAAYGQNEPQATDLNKAVVDTVMGIGYYGVFDNITYEVTGSEVTLAGQVHMAITKSEAVRRVGRIKGVTKVNDQIEVLPVSMNDDGLRMRLYRALFGTADLYRYAQGMIPTIHIVVKNGRVALEGIVSTTEDRRMAEIAVRGIPGVFSLKNNLRTEK